ncbi:MAG: class I SAM-dependent methyltransferase [Candidatus Fimenecus sp.]
MKKRFWDLYAPIYESAMRFDKKTYDYMYRRIPEVIKGKKVLEIATGPGILAKNVAYAAKSMTATDYSEGMIKQAKKNINLKNLSFEVVDAMTLPYNDKSFDVVIIANALHIIPEPEKAISEISRVLKYDGILIAPNFVHSEITVKSKLWLKILKVLGIKFEHEWSRKKYEDFLRQNGFKITKSVEIQARLKMAYVECVKY